MSKLQGYYVTYQKFDNETKTHRAATLASKILRSIPLTEYRLFLALTL
jgi:hypothetical protein